MDKPTVIARTHLTKPDYETVRLVASAEGRSVAGWIRRQVLLGLLGGSKDVA